MKSKTLYIVDIKKRQKLDKVIQKLDELNLSKFTILSLTPYSSFILEEMNISYITFENIISNNEFKEKILVEYAKMKVIFEQYQRYAYLFIRFAQLKSYEIYLKTIFEYIDMYSDITYITDAKAFTSIGKVLLNEESGIYMAKNLKVIHIPYYDRVFYKINQFKYNIVLFMKRKNKLKIILDRFKKNRLIFGYDNQYLLPFFKQFPIQKVNNSFIDKGFSDFSKEIKDLQNGTILSSQYEILLDSLNNELEQAKKIKEIELKPFTFLINNAELIRTLIFSDNNIPVVFMQHGNYLYQNMFIKEMEVLPADINFVINDYSAKYFDELGAKRSIVVGSKNFNVNIRNKKSKYDFLYVTYVADYSGNGFSVQLNYDHEFSIDGNTLYNQHKYVIALFGEKFPEKKFVIKVHPHLIKAGLYVPFWEMTQKYKNITLDVSSQMIDLFEKSHYIVSDYFTSEFLNREIHYKKDIVLINSKTTPIREALIREMRELFIFTDKLENLETNLKNIDETSKNRIRSNKLIEYYTSANIDTKKIMIEVLENTYGEYK